jgi:tRNA(Ile)-lysidine synthase TilS/MesJ
MSLPTPAALRTAASRLPRLPSPPEAAGSIAVAVSGGADSVYLLCALWADETVRPRLRVLHFDHRVRGETSAEDARFVAALGPGTVHPELREVVELHDRESRALQAGLGLA